MSRRQRLASYAELGELLEALPVAVRERRRSLGLSLREAGEVLGMSASTLARIEAGEDFNVRALPVLLAWLGGES